MSQQQDQALSSHLKSLAIENILVKGHPVGLFVLFFTEMWERFSYYGMRALLTIFLISDLASGGWGWSNADAMRLYGLYTGLVFFTPLIGGLIADRITGYKKAILIGAFTMTMGHLAMALEGVHSHFFILGLLLMILGNGLFKPNIASMVGKLYPDSSSKKEAGYTIFYMGINGGAFLGMMLCGYIGEKIGWHYGFGLAGFFMFLGMLQFYFARKIFGLLGEITVISEKSEEEIKESSFKSDAAKNIKRDRLIVIGIFMFASIIFHLAFEQAGGSMTIFAKNFTQRVLTGDSALLFKWVDASLTFIPISIVTVVLFVLAKKIWRIYPLIVLCSSFSFFVIWVLCGWKFLREVQLSSPEVPVSWFPMLNSFFVITLATVFSRMWDKVWNPSGPIKLALGLTFVGLSFAALAYGSLAIPSGAMTASVSMLWLVLAYFLQTVGELCLSPVGLAYVSKLSPPKIMGFLFGVWYCGNAIANFIGGFVGSYIDEITAKHSLSYFFSMFTIVSFIFALLLMLCSSKIKKMMHGIL